MKIVFIASEIAPYASTGGLAEVGGSLPRALVGQGMEVTRIMPMFRRVLEGSFNTRDTGVRIKVPVGFRSYTAEIWTVAEPGLTTYFIRRDEFFDRAYLYNLPDRDYDDNFERFLFFQKAAVALIDHLGLRADVVHANDWQTGLIPLYLEHGVTGKWRGCREKTVFTIHNLVFQGIFPGADYASTNLPFSCFSVDTLEYYGNVNCLKAGIMCANAVTTVSQSYAAEIQQESRGCGLHGVLQAARGRLTGIVNGIDPVEWNPEDDPHIAKPFSPRDLAGKNACRADLAKRLGLKLKPDAPLIGMVTRLSDDKGFGLLQDAVPQLLDRWPVSMAILGQGSKSYSDMCQAWAAKWPGRVAFLDAFDRVLGHRIIAGSDIFLMPSKVEPCGLSQLFSMRYGTVPVAHATGGLRDTIQPVGAGGDGCGFLFESFEVSSLMQSLECAMAAYGRRPEWQAIMRRGMTQDFSWQASAAAYGAIYRRLCGS